MRGKVGRAASAAPVLTVVTSANAPASVPALFAFFIQIENSRVSISGTNFGGADLTTTASLAAVCSTTSWSSPTAVTCKPQMAVSTAIGVTARMTIADLLGTLVGAFTFDGKQAASATPTVHCCIAPASASQLQRRFRAAIVEHAATAAPAPHPVLPLVPHNSPQSGGSVSVIGLNFGASDPTPTASLGAQCSTASWSSQTTVTCGAPLGLTKSPSLQISVSALVGTMLGVFTVDGKGCLDWAPAV